MLRTYEDDVCVMFLVLNKTMWLLQDGSSVFYLLFDLQPLLTISPVKWLVKSFTVHECSGFISTSMSQ